MLKQGILRPSNLPKLALCAWYRPQEEQSEAAARGTSVDTIYRRILGGLKDFPDGSAAEIQAADWAAGQTDVVVGNNLVLARKEDCQVQIPGFPAPGEVDALCPKLFCSFDLKTGQYYDYSLQMTAYAWGLMEKFFAETWTTWLLFCDLRRVYRYAFSYQRARQLVLEVRGRYEAAAAPVFNPYCSWCANAGECPVLINRADQALALTEKPRFDFQAVLASPQRLGAFLTACRGVEPYQQQASDRAKQYLQQKVEVPGWSLVTRSPGKYVEAPACNRSWTGSELLGCSRNMATCRRPNIKSFARRRESIPIPHQ
ncbi:MAG: hypothetical protein WB586_05880 [Chthoniobacterales bacterium]